MAENKAELKALCRGNRTDRGWESTEEGFWTPSVHDRRRVAVATLEMAAEKNDGVVHGPAIIQALQLNSTGPEDFETLVDNFNRWMTTNHQG